MPCCCRGRYYCNPLTYPTGGDWFDIDGNFLDIMLEIADLGGTNNYLVNYNSPNVNNSQKTVTLEVHYAGLGGYGSIQYTPPEGTLLRATTLEVNCYPNPFNPSISIDLNIPQMAIGQVKIFNLRGQKIQSFDALNSGHHYLRWNATDLKGRKVAAGIYFAQISLVDQNGVLQKNELLKLVHAK